MEAIKIEVTGNIARVIEKPAKITSGTVGLPVEFTFDSQWEGLSKIAVFKAGHISRDMPVMDGATAVPMEVLAKPNVRLNIGVYGVNEAGSIAIPTIWENAGKIYAGAVPDGNIGTDFGVAQKQYDAALAAAEKADASAKKAESEADRAEAAVNSANEIVGDFDEQAQITIRNIQGFTNNAYEAARDAAESERKAKGDADRAEAAAEGYYFTPREEIGVEHEDINTEYILGLYRALMENYPKNVQEVEVRSDDGTFANYAYVISTGDYPAGLYAKRGMNDEHIKKPKYLLLSGIDGNERKTALSTYRFIRDVLCGHNVPSYFKEDVIISVMPVGVPYAFDRFGRQNENGVYIERNFDCDWTPTTASGVNPGSYAASEKETQAISKWLRDNSDAELYIDVHNSGAVHELATIVGAPNSATTDAVKKIAMRGLGKITPYWRDVIGYSTLMSIDGEYKDVDGDGDKEYVIKEMDVIFANSASLEINGTSVALAQKVLDIPSIILETSAYYGDYPEWEQNKTAYPAESIAMGAEAIGNILIEFYEQASEVVAMNEANEKLDALLLNASFRVVKGTFIPTEDMYVLVPDASDSKKDKYHFTIPGVPTDACILEFMPVDEISKVSIGDYSAGQSIPVNYGVIPLMPRRLNDVRAGNLDYVIYQNDKETIGVQPTAQYKVELADGGVKWILAVADKVKFEVGKKYEWTAYYWGE